DFLLAASACGDTRIRARLLESVPIVRGGCKYCDGPMAHYFKNGPDPVLRVLAACSLREGETASVLAPLVDAMRTDRSVRPAAAARLSACGDTRGHLKASSIHADRQSTGEAIALLLSMTRDEDLEQRCAAVRALAAIAPDAEDVQDAFGRMLAMKEARVREV